MDTDGNVQVDIDTDNGDAIDDIKWDDNENNVDAVNKDMDGAVEVDIDTDTVNGDAINDINMRMRTMMIMMKNKASLTC